MESSKIPELTRAFEDSTTGTPDGAIPGRECSHPGKFEMPIGRRPFQPEG